MSMKNKDLKNIHDDVLNMYVPVVCANIFNSILNIMCDISDPYYSERVWLIPVYRLSERLIDSLQKHF